MLSLDQLYIIANYPSFVNNYSLLHLLTMIKCSEIIYIIRANHARRTQGENMVDGRDLAIAERALANIAGAGAFADPEMKVLMCKAGTTEITVLFEGDSYKWSNPSAGGVFPVRPVRSFFVGVQTDHDVEFCGYMHSASELITMDAKRNVLNRYILDEAQLFQQHP